jgi:hypothetical protein
VPQLVTVLTSGATASSSSSATRWKPKPVMRQTLRASRERRCLPVPCTIALYNKRPLLLVVEQLGPFDTAEVTGYLYAA